MKKGGIIAIVAMAIVIVVLIVALIVTNLPKKEVVDNTPQENIESVVETKPETKYPVYLSLDGEVAKTTFDMLQANGLRYLFYNFNSGVIELKDLSNEDIQSQAYYYACDKENSNFKNRVEGESMRNGQYYDGTVSKEKMDEAVKEIFGNIEYTPTYVYYSQNSTSKVAAYENDGLYYCYTGFGGSSPEALVQATIQVAEYEDRYEVIQKTVNTMRDERNVYAWFKTSSSTPIGDEDVTGVEAKIQMYAGHKFNPEGTILLLNKFYDQATTYKHTFMKNEDGSYHWVKSEII